jgi:hypothetical protein
MRSPRLAVLGLALSAFAAIAQAQPSPPGPAPRLQAAWVELTATGAQVRAVTADARCPAATVDGLTLPMEARAGPEAGFAQTVCQLDLPRGARRASVGGRVLPVPAGPPRRILIFGDTGCRVKGSAVQDCNDPRAWPFALVARLAAAQRPDLVIHVGDYYYREDPCPKLFASCAGGPFGDKWDTWRAEFFTPAEPLLGAAPWVFVRGNHESCARGGHGWFRLLDAAPRPAACPTTSAPFRIDLGDLSLYVLDSADADDRWPTADGVAALRGQLDRLEPDLARRPGWILTHRPIWGLAPVARVGPIGPLELSINRTEQVAVSDHDLSAVRMVVSGHIHHFAAYAFGPMRPAQLIVGTGGDVGETADVPAVRAGASSIDGLDASGMGFERFGYLLLDRVGDDWIGAFRDLDDRLIARCRLHGRALVCAKAERRS